VLDPEFQPDSARYRRAKTQAAEIEHAIRHHLVVNYDDDPALSALISAEIARILSELAGNWDAIAAEMEKLRQRLSARAQQETHGLDRKRQMPIFRILQAELFGSAELDEKQIAQLVNLTQLLFNAMQIEIRQVGFWDAAAEPKQNRLNRELQQILMGRDYYQLGPMTERHKRIRARLMEWARVPRNTYLICRP
jgi:type I restriction enzyme R subunit